MEAVNKFMHPQCCVLRGSLCLVNKVPDTSKWDARPETARTVYHGYHADEPKPPLELSQSPQDARRK